MARPLKEQAERRTALLQLRLTPTEHRRLSKRAEGQGLSEYSRAVLLGSRVKEPPATTSTVQPDPAILNHLVRIGNNLNQIARRLNADHPSGGQRVVHTELSSLCQQIEQFVIEARDGSKGRG